MDMDMDGKFHIHGNPAYDSSARMTANSEEIYSKSTISDFLLMVKSNHGCITCHL